MNSIIKFLSKQKLSLFFFFLYLILISFVFRSLLSNISTNLPDWRDYALADWIMNQNVEKITTLNFSNFFETNAFYPHKYSLLFSDLFLPQSFIDLPFLTLTHNPILSFNIVFLITLILNYISSFLVWKNLFKSQTLAFIGALLVCFSPFFHIESSHFQMLSFWPFMFSLYFLFKASEDKKFIYVFLTGLFLSIQFLASVYLSVFLLTAILIFYLSKTLMNKEYKFSIKQFLAILLAFLLLDGFFIKSYEDMKAYYNIHRDLKEFVTYSANLSDYLFTTPISSLIHQSELLKIWDRQNKNVGAMASFPGFTIFVLSIIGLFTTKFKQRNLSISINLDSVRLFFFVLITVGFLFSLGPRLKFNGNYAFIPTPYQLILKIIPFFEAVRAPIRWSFLLYLGLVFFSIEGIKKFNSKKIKLITCLILILFLLEYIPLNLSTHQENYINNHYLLLKNLCSQKKQALLEIPMTHLDVYPNIVEGVTYISKVELSSTYHKCNLVNGYSGYDLPSILSLRDKLDQDIMNDNSVGLVTDLRNSKVNLLKINSDYPIKELRLPLSKIMQDIVLIPGVHKLDDSIFSITD